MLFSLVLAVASKEVELWQTFDDFAPRRLMEDGEEVEDLEEPEMGDEENLEGEDDMGGDLTEEEEEGLNPLMIAVPAAAAVAVGAYFFMNQGQKEKQEDKPLMDRLTVDGLKNDSEVQIAAGATAAVAGLGLYALLGGAPTAPATAGFLSTGLGMGLAGATGIGSVGVLGHRAYTGKWIWGGAAKKSAMETYKEELAQLKATAATKKQEFDDIKKLEIEDQTAHEAKVTELKANLAAAADKDKPKIQKDLDDLNAKKTKAEVEKAKTAMENANTAVTDKEAKKPTEE